MASWGVRVSILAPTEQAQMTDVGWFLRGVRQLEIWGTATCRRVTPDMSRHSLVLGGRKCTWQKE